MGSTSGIRTVKEIRIGIVGAGQVVRERHLPGFRALPGVKIVGVCNQRRESAARFVREFGIPRVFGGWEDLVEDDEVDAVVIGAWPNMHCPVTLAAFDAGKHVLTQARMAMNAREAQRMLDRSRESPALTAMIVPSPYGLTGDAYLRRLIAEGFLGPLREVHVTGLSSDLADPQTPLGWRQMTKYSGFNMLSLGILYETALRWTPPVVKVLARASKLIPTRINPETGQEEPRRQPRQRPGADDPEGRLRRRLPAQRGRPPRRQPWRSRCTAPRGRSSTTCSATRSAAPRAGEPELHPLPIPDETARGLAGRGRLRGRHPRRAAP